MARSADVESYLADAQRWDQDLVARAEASRRRAYWVASAFGGLAALAMVAFNVMLPLKSVEPFVIRVDNTTGITDVVPVYVGKGEVAYMREKSSLAKTAILNDLPRFAGLTAKRFVCFWSGMVKQSVWLMVAYTTTTALLGLCGAWLLWREDRNIAILFLIPILLLPLPYYLTHPDYRFRCVVDPLMAILAAHALVTWAHTRKNSIPTVEPTK